MEWQFLQASGELLKYDKPLASKKVNVPEPTNQPITNSKDTLKISLLFFMYSKNLN